MTLSLTRAHSSDLSIFLSQLETKNIIQHLFFLSQLIKNNLRDSNYVNSFVCSKHSIVGRIQRLHSVCVSVLCRRVRADCTGSTIIIF